MENACVLFVGYSFQDSDIASMLYRMRSRNAANHWYAVFPRNDPNVRAMYAKRYGIKQINRTFTDFVAEVGTRLQLVPADWHSELPGAPTDPTSKTREGKRRSSNKEKKGSKME